MHTLQLLPGAERPSYAGAAPPGQGGCALHAQEAPPSPVFLRNGHGRSAPVPVPPSGAHGLGERWTAALEQLDSRVENERDPGDITGSAAASGKPKAASPRKPTFLERERWKAIQKARRKGLSLRAIERELGIHRATVRKYLDAEGPPTRRPWAGPPYSARNSDKNLWSQSVMLALGSCSIVHRSDGPESIIRATVAIILLRRALVTVCARIP